MHATPKPVLDESTLAAALAMLQERGIEASSPKDHEVCLLAVALKSHSAPVFGDFDPTLLLEEYLTWLDAHWQNPKASQNLQATLWLARHTLQALLRTKKSTQEELWTPQWFSEKYDFLQRFFALTPTPDHSLGRFLTHWLGVPQELSEWLSEQSHHDSNMHHTRQLPRVRTLPLALQRSLPSVQTLCQVQWESLSSFILPHVHFWVDVSFRRPFSIVLPSGQAHLFVAKPVPDSAFEAGQCIHEAAHIEHLLMAQAANTLQEHLTVYARERHAMRAEARYLANSPSLQLWADLTLHRAICVLAWEVGLLLNTQNRRGSFEQNGWQDFTDFCEQRGRTHEALDPSERLTYPFLAGAYAASAFSLIEELALASAAPSL